MKAHELRKKEAKELRKLLQDERDKLRGLRFNLASGRVKNIREIRSLKKTVARIQTLLKESEQTNHASS